MEEILDPLVHNLDDVNVLINRTGEFIMVDLRLTQDLQVEKL